MEKKTKIILAIVLIAVIGVGVGVGAWFLIVTEEEEYGRLRIGTLLTPGAPGDVNASQIIKVGVLGSLTEIQGGSQWKGTYLAVDEINTAGGLTINGSKYYFGLVGEDTYESEPVYDLAKAALATSKMLSQHDPHFILGGFRTEVVTAYLETIVAAHKIFLSCGVATDSFTENVGSNYEKYKYFFRITPINSTSLGGEIVKFLIALRGYLEIVLAKSVSKWALIYEDLAWTTPLVNALKGAMPIYGWDPTPVEDIAYPATATSVDFAQYWTDIENSHAQVVIPVISAQGGILMTTQYAALQPKCLIAGIDVMSQESSYWDETGGACENEIVLQTAIRTNKTSKTIQFWDTWVSKYKEEPIYNGIGAYDAVYLMKDAIEATNSLREDDLIAQLETYTRSNPIEGAGANLAFNSNHDLIEGYSGNTIYSVALFVQWQSGGAKECITSGGYVYPDSIITANMTLPSQGIND